MHSRIEDWMRQVRAGPLHGRRNGRRGFRSQRFSCKVGLQSEFHKALKKWFQPRGAGKKAEITQPAARVKKLPEICRKLKKLTDFPPLKILKRRSTSATVVVSSNATVTCKSLSPLNQTHNVQFRLNSPPHVEDDC